MHPSVATGDRSALPAEPPRPGYLRLVPDAPPATCPKCAHTVTADACARCGLLTSRAATFIASPEATIPHELVRAWREVRVRWRDPDAHDRLLVLAGRHGRYVWLAARYREIALRDDPIAHERRALVQRSVELTLAVALMRKHDADAEPRPHAATRRLFCVMLAVLALGVVLTKLLAGVA